MASTTSRREPYRLDPNLSTSHQLRGALKRAGWTLQESLTEIRLIKPGTQAAAEIIDRVLGPDEASENEPGKAVFELEYQLRDFLASNLGTINIDGHRLRLYVDATGQEGIEFPSATGPIDILAVDDKGSFFVFELKRAGSPDRAVGQVARYMGWVQQTIGKGREVYGVIVAKSISENLRYAVSVVPNVRLFEYQVEFHLQPAHEIAGRS